MDGTLGNLAYTLEDGREVTLSANYALLFKLRALKNDVYMRYNEAFKLVQKEPDYACASIIYAAYVMGVIGETGSAKDAMSEDDFLSVMPFDRERNMEMMSQLVLPNRAKASAKRS